jgi:hypothetical protein
VTKRPSGTLLTQILRENTLDLRLTRCLLFDVVGFYRQRSAVSELDIEMPEIAPNLLVLRLAQSIPRVSVQLAKARFSASANPPRDILCGSLWLC